MERIAGVVILYYPDPSILDNIASYYEKVDRLFLIDNSETPNQPLIESLKQAYELEYLHDGENKGIAARLNQAALLALSYNMQWLLTMDQDSSFTRANLEAYSACMAAYPTISEVAMFGVEYGPEATEPSGCRAIHAEHMITSGSFVNLSLFPKIGNFNEALFIDEVDLEYCYRSILAGYQIIKFTGVHLHHTLGKVTYHLSLKNFRSTPRTLHSPLRIYYMVRNHLYISSRYIKHFRNDVMRSRKGLRIRIKNNFLYGRQKWQLLTYIIMAFSDYRKNRMGKKIN